MVYLVRAVTPSFPRGGAGLVSLPYSRYAVPESHSVEDAVRVALGYDFHRLIEGRKLVLGGVEIASPVGPDAHSDGDFLVHAIFDALVGALAQGDVGTHFPDTDERWRGARSLGFLKKARRLLDENAYTIANIDANVILERPKLSPHFGAMRGNIAEALGIAPGDVSIKANTHEGFGEIGEGRAACAIAVALLVERPATGSPSDS
jgi:2-C-methyl-D-erythritol 2,4-cyclodiphosphate synthase